MNKKNILKLLVLLVLVAGILFAVSSLNVAEYIKCPSKIKTFILEFKVLSPIIFIFLYTLRTLLIGFPVAIFAILSGSLFGLGWGFIYSIIGAFLSATLAFFVGRYLARDIVNKYISERIKMLKNIEIKGFKIIILLRLIMILPYDGLSYVAGTSKITYKEFIAGNMLGIAPEFLMYSYLGYIGLNSDISVKEKIVMAGVILCIFVIIYVFKKIILSEDVLKIKEKNKI